MTAAEQLEQCLEAVVQRIGDPAPAVYQRLFALHPDLPALFINDARGGVRAEMFLRAVETLLEVAGGHPLAGGLIAAEVVNHQGWSVQPAQFLQFFAVLHQVCRDALGADWTSATEAAWAGTLARVAVLAGATGATGASGASGAPDASGGAAAP